MNTQRARPDYSQAVAPHLAEAPDALLVESLAAHPEAALAQAYERHADAVFGLARRLLIDHGMAEEVTHEVFLRLWRRPGRFDATRGSLHTFLLSDCYGRSIDRIRSESSRRKRETDDVVVDLRDNQSTDDPADAVCAAQDAGHVTASLDVLPQVEREAIILAYFGGHTYRDVAALLGTPEGTIKARIRRGLSRLRDHLSGTAR